MPEVRLIDANAFLFDVLPECKYPDALKAAVERQPTIEPEVRHGRWNYKKGDNKETVDGWICTNCKSGFNTKVPYFEVFKYCPMCGARMDATDTNVGGEGGAENA